MKSQSSIAVLAREARMQRYYRRSLPMLGHMLAGVAAQPDELAAIYQSQRPNLVLAHFSMVVWMTNRW